MLKGTLKFFDEKLGTLHYVVTAIDSFNDLKMYLEVDKSATLEIQSNITNSELFFDMDENGVLIPAFNNMHYVKGEYEIRDSKEVKDATSRRLDVKKTNKIKTTITNKNFAIKVAALIRYMQIAGKQNYNQKVVDTFSATRSVDIVEIKTKKKIGTIDYNMGLITRIDCSNKYCELHLETVDDTKIVESIFKELKEKDKFGHEMFTKPISISIIGFKLSDEILGFTYIPEVAKEIPQGYGMYQTIEEVIQANPDKNTAWILDQEYHIVSDDNLEEVIQMFYDWDGPIAYDTETSGLRINFKSRTNEADQLVGVVLSRKPGEGYYFPLQHKLFPNLCNGDHFYFMDKYMRKILEEKKIICHNLKFDWKVAYIYDINVNCFYDTMLAFGVTKRYEDETYELGLKALTKNIFGRDSFELSDFVMGGSFGDSEIAFWDLPYELVRQYAPADTDNTYALYEFLQKEKIIEKYEAQKIFEMEITFSKAVAYSEFYGYHIDVSKIPELSEQIVGEMNKCVKEMYEMAGKEFNPNSPAQLAEIMYDNLGVECIGDKRSTDKETLKTLASRTDEEGNPKYPFVNLIKKYRDNEAIYKNFLKRLPEFATSDGYIFPDVLQIGTNTGRVSVKNPNYQGYNDIVKHYVTPRQDFIHFDSDFAQIEQRVLTSYSCIMFKDREPLALMKDFDDPDMDYHQYQAARMFNVPYAAVTKSMRQQSKGINFGLPYGMGDESLGTRIFGERCPENTRKAADLRKKFFAGQELIADFFEKVRNEGVQRGYTQTQLGRRRYYHKGVFSEAEIRRQAGNQVVQGTAADIYKTAVNNMFNRICEEGWLGKVLINGFIHDEMLIEVHKSINMYYFFKVWRKEFEVRPTDYCRLYAGAGVGYCWYDAKKLDLPPLYIDEIIDKYKEDMEWDEDLDGFIADIKKGFKEHKIKRVKEYISDEKNHGEIIKPAINVLLAEDVENVLSDTKDSQEWIDKFNAVLPDDSALKLGEDNKVSGLQNLLKVFCLYYGVDYDTIDIKDVSDVDLSTHGRSGSGSSDELEEDEVELSVSPEELLALSLTANGVYIDHETETIHIAEIYIKLAKGLEKGTKYFIDNFLIIKETPDMKGSQWYKIKYYPTLKTDTLTSYEIPGFVVPKKNALVLMRFYREMLSRGQARLG